MACASSTLPSNSRLRHSSRKRQLKLSFTPFCHGLPGSLKRILMPACARHSCSARATSSAPLSHRRGRGAPRTPIAVCSARITSAAPSYRLATIIDAVVAALVGDRQELDRRARGRDLKDRIQAPGVIEPFRPDPGLRPGRALGPLTRPGNPQSLLPPDALHHAPSATVALPLDQGVDPPVAIVRIATSGSASRESRPSSPTAQISGVR